MRPLLFVAGTLGLSLLVGAGAYQSARVLRDVRLDFNLLLHPAQVFLQAALVILCVGLGMLSGLPARHLGWQAPAPLPDLALGVAVGGLVPLILNSLTRMAAARWGHGIYSPAVIWAALPRRRSEWLWLPLALIPTVLGEELLFRSLWVGGIGYLTSPWLMAGLSAILFGAMHLPQGRLGVLGTGILGFGLAGLFIWRGSLLPAAVAHYLINVAQLIHASRHREWIEHYPGH